MGKRSEAERSALRRADKPQINTDMPDDYQEPNEPTPEQEAEARSRAAFCSALARQFHDRYEELAPLYGYKTREDTKTFDPDSTNGQLMQAVCLHVVGPILARLQGIATMPEYDQDDAHRLRDMARRFLSQNA